MVTIRENGREITAQEIRKMYSKRNGVSKADFTGDLDYSDLVKIARSGRSAQRAAQAADLAKRVKRAVAADSINLQANGVSESLELIKIAHQGGSPYDPDMLTKLSFPPQSDNGRNDSVTANTGATNSFRDQGTDVKTRATVMPGQVRGNTSGSPRVSAQVTTDVAQSKNIAAALDAIKQDLARGAKRGM